MEIPKTTFSKTKAPVQIVTKIWVISVVMEPLLFFVLADRTQVGIGLNFSRLLQVMVVGILLLNFLVRKTFFNTKNGFGLISTYSLSILYIFISTLILILLDAYPTPTALSDSKSLVDYFNSNEVRPAIEAFIILYQFFYFLVLPLLLLKRKVDFDYFFKILFFFLALHYILGYIDFFVNLQGQQFIPRHLADGVYVGLRWHGIAGEPRDAAAYNLSLFFILATYSIYKYGSVIKINIAFCILLLLSLLLTFSASFIVGVIISAGLICLIYLIRLKFIELVKCGAIGVVICTAIYFVAITSDRLVDYYNAYNEILFNLYKDPYIELPDLIGNSFNNVYPLIYILRDILLELNIYALLFGYGIGSSGVVNQNIYGVFYNPNNQLVRIVFEYGLVGFGILIFGIVKFFKRATISIDRKSKNFLLLALLLMIGGVLAHRSNVWIIWLGIFGAVSLYKTRFLSFNPINK